MKRILIVEDNVDLASGLRRNLEVEGHKATVAGTAAAAIETAMRESPDLLVLDLGLPDRDGYYVLEQLRSRGCSAPVLILSARGAERRQGRGFRLGPMTTSPSRSGWSSSWRASVRTCGAPAPTKGR
ncbi:MAG: response regulator [Gemmatimonadetes bacterium]|nr:response regulator [Gemmatimonadota bacterium]